MVQLDHYLQWVYRTIRHSYRSGAGNASIGPSDNPGRATTVKCLGCHRARCRIRPSTRPACPQKVLFRVCRSKTAYVFAATVRQHDATVARSAAAAPVQAAFSVDDGAHVVFSVFLVLDARTTVSRRIGIISRIGSRIRRPLGDRQVNATFNCGHHVSRGWYMAFMKLSIQRQLRS